MRFGGAPAGRLVFGFGTFFMAWLAWPLTNIFPLLPWLLLLAELARPAPRGAAGGGPGGARRARLPRRPPGDELPHPPGDRRLLRLPRAPGLVDRGPRTRSALVRPVVAFGVAFVVGAAIAAVMLVPFFELLVRSGDFARRLATAPATPTPTSADAVPLDYWGRPTQTPLAGIISNRALLRGWADAHPGRVGLPAPHAAAGRRRGLRGAGPDRRARRSTPSSRR